MNTGRPSIYTEELATTICHRIAEGESLRSICVDENMPSASTICRWLLDEEKKTFWEQYAHARNVQAELMFEELLEIADKSDKVVSSGAAKKSGAYANNQRLRVDTRKWYLSKVLPKKFGEKLDLTSDGKAIKGNTIIFKDFNGAERQ
jgi:uncharacterized protein (DUF2147 family)